eukprot:TRINITY_DN908_c0_g1_i1.p1 TRINITY_DN908_c0_g1~~TRINITY_DN908_c0_g1_i1.p1  ORF type:complete len:150 (+),score=42.71 TRINITY_DN908_c0_g1_i1:123-572(+)
MGWDDDEWGEEPAQSSKQVERKKNDDTEVVKDSESSQKIISKDSLQDINLNLMKDVDQLVKLLVPKVKDAVAKKAAVKFLNDSLNGLQMKLSLAETEQLHKTCKDLCAKKKKKQVEDERKAKELEDEKKRQEQLANTGVTDEDFFKDFM